MNWCQKCEFHNETLHTVCYGMVLQSKFVFDISYQRIAHEMEILSTN